MPTATLALALLLELAGAPRVLVVHAVELDVRLDPVAARLSGKIKLELRSRRVQLVETLTLVIPRPFHERTRIETIWDDTGILPWHTEPADAGLAILITFPTPLPPLARRTVVVSFELDLKRADSSAPAQLSEKTAVLRGLGWYPLPPQDLAGPVRRLHLDLRVPREWEVRRNGPLKPRRIGTQFAAYEITAQQVKPEALLFEARAQ